MQIYRISWRRYKSTVKGTISLLLNAHMGITSICNEDKLLLLDSPTATLGTMMYKETKLNKTNTEKLVCHHHCTSDL